MDRSLLNSPPLANAKQEATATERVLRVSHDLPACSRRRCAATLYAEPLADPLQMVMIAAPSAPITIVLLLAILLEPPCSGTISVSKPPFEQSTLLLGSGAP